MTGYFDLTSNDAGHYSFNLRAGNHEVILTSQVYKRKTAALAGIEAVRESSALVDRFEEGPIRAAGEIRRQAPVRDQVDNRNAHP